MENIQNEQILETQEIKKTVSKKSEKVKEVKKMESTKKSFKELSEMSIDEINELGKASVILRKTHNKKRKTNFFEIEVRLHDNLKVKTNIQESQYIVYLIKLGLDQKFAEHTLRVPCRFVNGINSNGNNYRQIELVLGENLFFGNLWLNSFDLELFDILLPNVTMYNREKTIDGQTVNVNYEE